MRSARSHRALLAALALLSVGCATLLAPAPWFEVTTPNFRIVSDLEPEAAADLARKLEQLRAFVLAVTGSPARAPVPTTITAFRRESAFDEYRQSRDVAGYFMPSLRENHVLLSKTSRTETASVVLHEYVHFVLRNGTALAYPIWYEEGFAELLSTAHVRGDLLVIGAVPRSRILSFQGSPWIPLGRIVSARSYGDFGSRERHMFYAESWALVHYLTLDRDESRDLRAELLRYIELVEAGRSDEEAFGRAFGEPPGSVGGKLMRALGRGQLPVVGIPMNALDFEAPEPRVRLMGPAEVDAHLGNLALVHGDGERAQRRFEVARVADPMRARTYAGLGDAYKFQGRFDAAEPHYRRALELDPDDALNWLDLAEFLHDAALRASGAADRADLLRQARRAYVRSQELDPAIPETYAMYGRTFLAPGEDPAEGLEALEHARSRLRSHEVILDLLIEAYVALDRIENARELLARRLAWTEGGDPTEGVEERIAAIRARRASQAPAD